MDGQLTKRRFGIVLFLCLSWVGRVPAEDLSDALKKVVAIAKAGETIELPAGTFTGGVVLPAGVSLHGSGVDRTIIDAGGADNGITIEGGSGASVTGVRVRHARRADLYAHGVKKLTVSRVYAGESINGILFDGVEGGRIENTISADNRYGIIVSGGADNVVVNCTLAHNDSLGLSLPAGKNAVAFNNCITDGSIGVYLGDPAQVHLDHNLYFTSLTGGMANQIARPALIDWQYLSRQDARSVRMPVRYRAEEPGMYVPADALPWALDRAVTGGWGAAEFAGVKAPAEDVRGNARPAAPAVGAYEVKLEAPRPADGSFTINSDEGIKSAGVFTPQGREVAYLFHNLPLTKGTYRFWLPPRDYVGQPIPAGTYDVRIAESDLRWKYLGYFGDNGEVYPWSKTASVGPGWVAFDENGHLLMGQGWSEDHTQLRAYDLNTGKVSWSSAGEEFVAMVAGAEDGSVYLLRAMDKKARLTHLDGKTGDVIPYAAGGKTDYYLLPEHVGEPTGFAEMDGKLYVSLAGENTIRSDSVSPKGFDKTISIPAPTAIGADRKSHLLWAISGGKEIVALDADGKIVAQATPVDEPVALAVRDGVLAVASRADGKVHLFDCADPHALKPTRTLGTGDGPYGPFAPDRFLFQGREKANVNLALGPDGRVALADGNRLLLFDKDGKCPWYTFGVFGNGTSPCLTDRRHVFDPPSGWSMLLDEATGQWKPEAFWQFPYPGAFPTFFEKDGQLFGFWHRPAPDVSVLIARFDHYRGIPVLQVVSANGHLAWRTDTNGDGKIDASDKLEPMLGPDGKDAGGELLGNTPPNGDVDVNGDFGAWHLERIENGVPKYRLKNPLPPAFVAKPFVSPYDGKPQDAAPAGTALMPDGTRALNVYVRSSPLGAGLANGCGTDVAGYDPQGNLRWFHPLSVYAIYNMNAVGQIGIVGTAQTNNIIAFDSDGLGLGGCSQPAEARYMGFWLDHPPAIQVYRGHDGRPYVITADNSNGRHHWYRIENEQSVRAYKTAMNLSDDSARALAAAPPPAAPPLKPRSPVIHLPRLAEPFTIDGGLQKWRDAQITPQVLVTPDTAYGEIDGPKDASAVVRLAWRDKDLYVQVLRFCKVVNMTQPTPRHYQQDCVEMNLNGFAEGFKFDFTRTLDHGDLLIRQRFFFGNLERIFDKSVAPLSITVLDTAKDVPERKLIESVYGVDMTDCKVIVSELKLPIDERTYDGDLKALIPMQPGQKFRIGFMIDSNDHPGADGQNFLVWPATYGTFNPKEEMAEAVLEP